MNLCRHLNMSRQSLTLDPKRSSTLLIEQQLAVTDIIARMYFFAAACLPPSGPAKAHAPRTVGIPQAITPSMLLDNKLAFQTNRSRPTRLQGPVPQRDTESRFLIRQPTDHSEAVRCHSERSEESHS